MLELYIQKLYVQETWMHFSRHISSHLIELRLLCIAWFCNFEKQSATCWLLILCPATMLNSCSNYQQGGFRFSAYRRTSSINTGRFVSYFPITMPLYLFHLYLTDLIHWDDGLKMAACLPFVGTGHIFQRDLFIGLFVLPSYLPLLVFFMSLNIHGYWYLSDISAPFGGDHVIFSDIFS